MYTDGVNHLDLKTSTLEGVDDETQRSRSIGTREDVFVHEKTPGEVLELPSLTETSNLKEEDTVIIEHIIDLTEEAAQVADTNVLSHLETGNLVVATRRERDVAVVHAENLGLVFFDTSLPEAVVAPSSLVATESNTSSVGAVVDRGKLGKSTPSATNIEHLLALLQSDLFTDD